MEKRDSKGRILRPNESQVEGGRYRYRYFDSEGKRKSIYAWKLVPTDKTPQGKKEDLSLREKEKVIMKDLEDGIKTTDGNMTVSELITFYLETKPKLANSTRNNYIFFQTNYINAHLYGKLKVNKVKKSDTKKFYAFLYKEKGLCAGTLQIMQNLIYPAFQMLVEDSVIRLNPCRGCMKEYVGGSVSTTKYPLTIEEQNALLNFVKNDNVYSKYYVMVALMLSTGLRISEVLGITFPDINLDEGYIDVNHQIIYKKKDGACKHYAELPKNRATRRIPLQNEMISILKKHKEETYFISKISEVNIDGYGEFLFLNSRMKLYTPNTIVRTFHLMRDAYNDGKVEGEDVTLRDFTPHTLRHTYCTRMAEAGIDVRVLQELMGHKTIEITMKIYNHVNDNRIKNAVSAVPDLLALEA